MRKVAALVVGGAKSDQDLLHRICKESGWDLYRARNRQGASRVLRRMHVRVVITDRDLPQGDWRDLLADLTSLEEPPMLVVTSRLADDSLWAEVLNMGGYDVLAQPFDSEEVTRVIGAALRRDDNERERVLVMSAAG